MFDSNKKRGQRLKLEKTKLVGKALRRIAPIDNIIYEKLDPDCSVSKSIISLASMAQW